MEYAIRHSAAIAREGVEVHFLCKPSFPAERLGTGIILEKFQERRGARGESRRFAGKLSTILRLTLGQRRNAKQVVVLATKLAQTSSTRNPLPFTHQRPVSAEVVVLFACYKEYFSPFWVGPLKRLARRGVVIGTIAHDPVRDFVVGPLWWHRWSVRLGYSFVRDVFVHDATPVDFGGEKPDGIRVHQIPHGPYEVAEPKIGRLEMRRRLGFSTTKNTNLHEKVKIIGTNEEEAGLELDNQKDLSTRAAKDSGAFGKNSSSVFIREIRGQKSSGAPEALALDARRSTLDTYAPADVVFLAFGQIRDGKNLDLFLQAMTILPKHVKLLVAGKGDSGSSKPPEFYQKLAEELGVADRCRWDIRRIPDDEVGDILAACDVVLVTYSAKFRSASGVMNAAVSARKPVLASSGPGPFKSVVNKYNLGLFVEPDNLEAVLRGAMQLLDPLSSPSIQTLDTSDSPHDTAGFLLPAWDRYECDYSWEQNVKIISSFLWSLR